MKQKRIIDDHLFRKLFENNHSGIMLLDASFQTIYHSPSAQHINGWDVLEQSQTSIQEPAHFDDQLIVRNTLQNVLAVPGLSLTCCFRAKPEIWLECTYTNMLVDPAVAAIVCNFRDVSKQKKEEDRLKLLESVITNTMDAVLITEAGPFDEPGPRILYVNEAFTKMTGYTADEVIGKTPRMLQGPKTDMQEVKRLSECMRRWESCEVTLINYKKNGEEFWINFTLNLVAGEKGRFTHWIAIERDVTQRKNEEMKKSLLSGISLIFNEPLALNLLLDKLLQRLVDYGNFTLAEVWLIGADKNRISLAAHISGIPDMKQFYDASERLKSFAKGESLPGAAWAVQNILVWDHLDERKEFIRRHAARLADLKKAYGIPLVSENAVIGVLLLGMCDDEIPENNLIALFNSFGTHFGAEIRRKQLEQDLDQVFNFAPDIIAILGADRYFKKVNPAMSILLEYTEEELLAMPMNALVHPDELVESKARTQSFVKAGATIYFENRFITKSGKIKWISWTATSGTEEGLIFCVGKDITDKKNLENLLNKVNGLARIGGWEVDLVRETLYWSTITKEIHEVAGDFEPGLATGLSFYKEGKDRSLITRKVNKAIEKRTAFDLELQIVTAKKNIKWVRVIGEPEFIDGKCVRIYGSFQDVDARVKAELNAKHALKERNIILESIGDAFFAVDKNWVVNYWNKMAEKALRRTKKEVLGHDLWDIFADAINSDSYKKYHLAIESGKPVHFEDYYQPLDKWYEIGAYPSAYGLSVYFKDISERKLSEARLMESEKRYSELFQFSPLPKWVFDLDTLRFLDVNQAAIHHYGYSRKEFLSMTIKDIRPPGKIPEMEKALIRDAKQKTVTFHDVFTHKKKDANLIQVDAQSKHIQYKGKRAKIVAINDITERLNYIQAIEEQNVKLKEISWMQSHVIRAPLARIMALIPLAVDEQTNAVDRKQILDYLQTSATELDEVIGDITNKTAVADYTGMTKNQKTAVLAQSSSK
ncbi:PAS domain S-box protein [Mucilaginibacter sp. BJC16-A38]|uniref:PAS domain-containing protein n=1 Tax=Mucilaginibacter phenanthrenivorans TaxID=1234842 RepID=UPI00215790FC|nr:PAS domain S-box protein [Mucilaginibacter phenanthrenivorans]MCR8556523.1 PAS domain S-box protein [Mucilaginibacter phenanthrenivorans]